MGQLKKLVPKQARNRIFESVDPYLPEGSFIRKHFANAISVSGALLVVSGAVADAKGHEKIGMVMRGVGETADDFDGDSSRRLNTDGHTGALVDSVLDKIKIAMEVTVLWKHTSSMFGPESYDRKKRLSVIAGKHIVNASLNTYITARGQEAHSSTSGQVNMWMDGLTIGFWGIADVSESQSIKTTTNTIGNIAFSAGLLTGAASIYGYAVQAIDSHNQTELF